jgi:hypothetical protein
MPDKHSNIMLKRRIKIIPRKEEKSVESKSAKSSPSR